MDAPPRPRAWIVALLLFGAALALYARTADFAFVEYDDPAYVRDNPHLAQGLSPASVAWALTSTSYQYNWHPLTWLSHALDVELFGLDAGRHHLVNALLHALNAALFFLAFRALSGRSWPSACVAALFALHPLRVESVAWIAERKDVLAGTFLALTLLAYARHARAPSRARFVWVVLALAAGLMAKPTLVTVPFVLLLLDVGPLGRGAESHAPASRRTPRELWLEKLPLFALSLASIVLTLVSQQRGGALRASIALSERLANAALAYPTTLAQFFWPFDLAVFYPHPALVEPEHSRWLAAALALLGLALLGALAWRARRSAPWMVVGTCWFLGMLVPMSGLLQVGYLAHADRYAYLAQLGLELALVFGTAELARARPALRPALASLCALVLGALALRSWNQLGVWRDSRALFEHALAVTEHNFVAHNNLGLVLATEGREDEALAHFEAAAAAWPGFPEAELNAGYSRYRRGEYALARAAFERALAANPKSGAAHLYLGATLAREGDFARAETELDAALASEPTLQGDARALGLRALLDGRGQDAPR